MNAKTVCTPIVAIAAMISTVCAFAADAPKMKMTTDIPESILTPDSAAWSGSRPTRVDWSSPASTDVVIFMPMSRTDQSRGIEPWTRTRYTAGQFIVALVLFAGTIVAALMGMSEVSIFPGPGASARRV